MLSAESYIWMWYCHRLRRLAGSHENRLESGANPVFLVAGLLAAQLRPQASFEWNHPAQVSRYVRHAVGTMMSAPVTASLMTVAESQRRTPTAR